MIETLDFLRNIPLYDHFLVLFFLVMMIIGFLRGGARIVIHSAWFIIGIVLAGYLYQDVRELGIFDIFTTNEALNLFSSFLLILVVFYAIKIALYRSLAAIANLHGPCPVNRFLAFLVGYGLVAVLSWYIALDVQNITLLVDLIEHQLLRFALSFILIIFTLLTIGYIFFVLFDVHVGIDKPCPLLKALQPLDGILNAKSINSLSNSLGGVLLGLLQAFVIIILALIIVHQTSWAQYEIFSHPEGLLQVFDGIALKTNAVLAHYLSFLQ